MALLACALVDPDLADRWAESAAPVSAEKRLSAMGRYIVHVINAQWTILAETRMSSRNNYGNPFSDLLVKGPFPGTLAHRSAKSGSTYAQASRATCRRLH